MTEHPSDQVLPATRKRKMLANPGMTARGPDARRRETLQIRDNFAKGDQSTPLGIDLQGSETITDSPTAGGLGGLRTFLVDEVCGGLAKSLVQPAHPGRHLVVLLTAQQVLPAAGCGVQMN